MIFNYYTSFYMILEISKKKKEEFDKVFYQIDSVNVSIDIDLLKKIIDGDYYEHFLNYLEIKINKITENNIFYIHIDIKTFNVSDLFYYDNIVKFANILHKYTDKLKYIYIYNSSYIFNNLIHMIANTLNVPINNKIIYDEMENFNIKFKKYNNFLS